MTSENSFPFKFKDILEQNFELKSSYKNGDENISSRESNNLEININDNFDINKIKELNSKSVDLILEEKVEKALEILKKMELFFETNIIEPKYDIDKKIIIIILHNLSCCYQKIKDYDNCIMYLDSVIFHFDKGLEQKHKIRINEDYFYNIINKDQSDYSLLGDLILELRFSSKFHLQMCAALSQSNRHIEAIKHAKLAGLICEDNLIKTYYLFIQMKLKNIFSNDNKFKGNNNFEENDFDIKLNSQKMKLTQQIINDLFREINSIKRNFYSNGSKDNNLDRNNNFDSYLNYRKSEISKYEKNNILLNNIRNVFGNEVKKDDWIQLLNIGNIMYLSALNEEDLDLDSDPKYEILRDAILEKIVMLTVSYFCIAMEMHQLSKDKNDNKTNGEFFLYHAVILSEKYLPVSCPIVKHYINSYYKYYGKNLDVIPEGKILDYKIDLVRNDLENNKDVQSFVKMQKINYTNNIINKGNLSLKLNNNAKSINNLNIMKENINNNDIQSLEARKSKIPLGLKFNLNFTSIINNNMNNTNLNNSGSNHTNASNKFNGPQNTKLTISSDSKFGNTSINKNNIYNNDILQNSSDNYHPFFNKNYLHVAEKSKIRDLPKFKLNFNKINVENNIEENKLDIVKNIKNISNKINNLYNNKIKKINNKITMGSKGNRNSSSGYKINKNYNMNKNKGYKTERPKSNKRPNVKNNNGTSIINQNDKNNGFDIRRNSFILPYYSNKYLSETSRYKYSREKSPISSKKNLKAKGNLTDRDRVTVNKSEIAQEQNQNKSTRKSNESLIHKISFKNKSTYGYQTQRELTNYKQKINLGISIHSGKKSKSPFNTKSGRKVKSSEKISKIKHENKTNKKSSSVNSKEKDNKNSIYNTNNNTNNKLKNNMKKNKLNSSKTKLKSSNEKYNSKKNKSINYINNLYKNLFYIGNKGNGNNYFDNYRKTIAYNKYGINTGQINNINSFIKIQNPFKI